MRRVVPHEEPTVEDLEGPEDGGGVLSLANFSPDLNNDGVVDAWEEDVYKRMMAADVDNDGYLTRSEVLLVMKGVHEEINDAKKGMGLEIPISALNPDTDGDGKVAPWEKEVFDRIVAADTDRSGAISVRNLFDFIRSMSNEVKEASKGGIPISSLDPDTDGDGKVEKWEMEVFERIKDADEDKSGSINVKELFGVIKGAAESDRQKRLFRKLFLLAALLLLFMLVANMGLTGAVVFLAKDMSTGSDGVSRSTSGAYVQTGSLEEIIQSPAAIDTFDRLAVESDILRTRPSSVKIDFVDGSMVQFPPLQIQLFATSALVANLQIGVALRMRQDTVPIFEFTGGGGTQLAETTLPTGAADATARAASTPQLSAISRISIYRKLGGMVETALQPSANASRRLAEAQSDASDYHPRLLTHELGSGEMSSTLMELTPSPSPMPSDTMGPAIVGQSASSDGVPKSSAQTARDTMAAIGAATKYGRIPLLMDADPSKRAPNNSTVTQMWMFTLNDVMTVDMPTLCSALATNDIMCLGTEFATVSHALTVNASKMSIQTFRDSVASRPHMSYLQSEVQSIAKVPDSQPTVAGIVRTTDQTPHPIHLALRASARRALMQTHAGHQLKHRKLADIHERGIGEAHRRRLGWADSDFMYRMGDLTFNRVENVDCFNAANPGAYAGTSVTTLDDGTTPCASWASAATAFGIPQTAGGICSLFGKTPNPSFTGSLDDSPSTPSLPNGRGYPRAACASFLGGAPFCMTNSGGWSASTVPNSLQSCAEMYVEDLKRAYQPGYAGHDTTKTPIKANWTWHLNRIQLNDAVYDNDPNQLLYNGSGVHVFVIDTGCNLEHNEFEGRVGTSYRAYPVGDEGPVECEASDTSKCTDFNGHGTHCASTILGATAGVAPGAIIHCVGTRLGQPGSVADIARGLAWIRDYYERNLSPTGIPAIVSASLGGGASTYLDTHFRNMANAGILTLIAAGNSDADSCNYSPARLGAEPHVNVLTIGASAVDDSKGLFSNWGSCTNMWAPGVGILAARHDSNILMTVMSGTSMATPVVAGVAALAMEVAGVASMSGTTYMRSQTASAVKNWLMRTALSDKITALRPSSIVPVHFVTEVETSFPNNYAVRQFSVPSTGPNSPVTNEMENVAATPNLLVHLPTYLQQVPTSAIAPNPVPCSSYAAPTYEGDCPPSGMQFCGDPYGTSPDGQALLRPYRAARRTCAPGCVCEEQDTLSYESCAQREGEYTFTYQPCSPVYSVDSEDVATGLSGLELKWTPLPGGEGYDQVDVSESEGLDQYAIGALPSGLRFEGSDAFYGFRVYTYEMTDDGGLVMSTTYSTPFHFYGEPYNSLYVYRNGYICFTPASQFDRKTFATFEDHFKPAAGPCFSFLLNDLSAGRIKVYKELKWLGGTFVAHRQTITFNNAVLVGSEYTGGGAVRATVQLTLLFATNEILVKYVSLDPAVSAVIGPTNGTGMPLGFLSAMPQLPIAPSD